MDLRHFQEAKSEIRIILSFTYHQVCNFVSSHSFHSSAVNFQYFIINMKCTLKIQIKLVLRKVNLL